MEEEIEFEFSDKPEIDDDSELQIDNNAFDTSDVYSNENEEDVIDESKSESEIAVSKYINEKYGFEVDENITYEEALDNLVYSFQQANEEIESLRQEIENLKNGNNNNTYESVLEKIGREKKEFLSIPEKDVIIEYLKNSEYTDEEALEEYEALLSEGKIDREYRKIKSQYLKAFKEKEDNAQLEVNKIKEQEEYEKSLRTQKEELEYQQEINNFVSIADDFKSDYFELDKKEKDGIKRAFLVRDEDGMTLFEKMIADDKVAIEMFLAWQEAPKYKSKINNANKQALKIVSEEFANEAIFDGKSSDNIYENSDLNSVWNKM